MLAPRAWLLDRPCGTRVSCHANALIHHLNETTTARTGTRLPPRGTIAVRGDDQPAHGGRDARIPRRPVHTGRTRGDARPLERRAVPARRRAVLEDPRA